MNILFVCKHNKFRSQVAEAFFKKLNKNNKYKSKSAGIIHGRMINKKLKDYTKKYGIKINSSPKSITTDMLRWADLIILVANNVPRSIFKDKKIKIWMINDAGINEEEKVNKIIEQIKRRVNILIKELD